MAKLDSDNSMLWLTYFGKSSAPSKKKQTSNHYENMQYNIEQCLVEKKQVELSNLLAKYMQNRVEKTHNNFESQLKYFPDYTH